MRRFPGTRTPNTDFAAVRSDLQATPLYLDVDLATARSLVAGTQLELPLNGNVIYIDQKAASGFATLHFNDDAVKGNTGFTAFPGFVARVPFTKLILENVAQPGMTMRIIYGVDIDFQPAVSAGVFGEVSVVDGGQSLTLANQAFACSTGIGGVAAQYAHVQLLNPAGSGKRVVVRQLLMTSDTAGRMRLIRYDTALANPFSAPAKLVGGVASSAICRSDTNAALLGTGDTFLMAELVANTSLPVTFREPFVLTEGKGIVVRFEVVLATIRVTYEFTEETP